jgi:hypothetical protein
MEKERPRILSALARRRGARTPCRAAPSATPAQLALKTRPGPCLTLERKPLLADLHTRRARRRHGRPCPRAAGRRRRQRVGHAGRPARLARGGSELYRARGQRHERHQRRRRQRHSARWECPPLQNALCPITAIFPGHSRLPLLQGRLFHNPSSPRAPQCGRAFSSRAGPKAVKACLLPDLERHAAAPILAVAHRWHAHWKHAESPGSCGPHNRSRAQPPHASLPPACAHRTALAPSCRPVAMASIGITHRLETARCGLYCRRRTGKPLRGA